MDFQQQIKEKLVSLKQIKNGILSTVRSIEEVLVSRMISNYMFLRCFMCDLNGNSIRLPREIDFTVNSGGERTYIQSAFALPTEEKQTTELKPFTLIGDSFPKIIVRKDIRKRWYDDIGVLNIGLIDFLLNDMVV